MNKYDSFDDWFFEIEKFTMRGERFYDEFSNMTPQRAVEWLQAAWNSAKEETCPYCSDPELGQVTYDQTCRCCVERMSKHVRELVK